MFKKSLLATLLLALLMPYTLKAYTLTVGDQTTQDEYIPVYGDHTDMIQHNQMLYPAASLASMIGQDITEMVFYIQSWGADPYSGDGLPGDWIVSFGETVATTLTGLDNTTTLTQVYSGAMTFDSGHTTMTITFDNSYTYNGGNLLVDFNHTTPASHRHIFFYGTAATGAAVYKLGASGNVNIKDFLPKTTFTYGTPTCPKPTLNEIADEDIEATSATIRWVANGEGQTLFDIYYSTTNTAPTELTTPSYSNVTGTSKEITGLIPATTYYVWLRGNCGTAQDPDISGGWTAAKSFKTDCGAIPVGYSCGFEGPNTGGTTSYPLPDCWTRIPSNANYPYCSTYGYNNTGSHCLYFYGSTEYYAVLPEIEGGVNGKRLSYYERGAYSYSIGYMTDPTDASTFVAVATKTGASSYPSTPYTVDFGEYAGNPRFIAIKANSTSSVYFDDITLSNAPSCLAPTMNGAATAIGTQAATLSWTACKVGQTHWDVYYSTSSDAPTASTAPNVEYTTDNPCTITGLTPATTYYAWVRGNCGTVGEPEYSDWSDSYCRFTTDCGTKDIPYPEYFDTYNGVSSSTTPLLSYPEDPLPTCWSFLNRSTSTSTYPLVFLTSYSNYVVSGKSLFFKSSKSTPIYAILPEFSDEISTLQLTFKYRNEGTTAGNGTLYVGYLTDKTDTSTFDTLYICPKTSSFTEVGPIYFKNAPAGSYIAFKYGGGTNDNYYLSIDNVDVTEAPSCFPIETLNATTTPGQGTKATLNWTKGNEEDAWILQYATNSTFTEGLVEVTTGFTTSGNNISYLATGLTTETTYYARVKANCGGSTSEWSATVSFTPSNYLDLIYNSTASTSNSNIPFNGSYTTNATNQSQFIIPASGLVEVAGGNIRSITYHTNSSSTTNWGGAIFDVYMAEVEQDVYSTTAFVDWATLGTPVYTGTVSLSNRQMTIVFNNDFDYAGGNLLIGFKINTPGTSNTSVNWTSEYDNSAYTQIQQYGSYSASRSYYQPKVTLNYKPTPFPGVATINQGITTATTVEFSWIVPNENVTGYKYQYKLTSANEWPAEWSSTTSTSCELTGLTSASYYDFRIKAIYGSDESPITTTSFNTLCGDAIATFPWHEDFEGFTANPSNSTISYNIDYTIHHPCWENEHISGNGTKLFQVTSYYQGDNHTQMLQLVDQNLGTLTKLRLPEMDLSGGNYQFVLDIYRSNSTYHDPEYASEGIRVFASTDGEIAGATELAFVPRQYNVSNALIPAEDNIGWYTYEIPIGMSSNCYIILRGESQDCTSTFMDNFVVEPIPSCKRPSRLAYSDVTDHSVTLAWTAGDTDQHDWQIAYSTTSFDPNDPSFNISTVSVIDCSTETTCTYRIDKLLEADNTYYIYVRANCGGGDYSPWSRKAVTITTDTAPHAPTSFTVSEIQAHQATFDWTNGGGDLETSWTIYLSNDSIDINNTPDGSLVPANLHNFNSHPATITGLNHETKYYAWVRSDCGTDGLSAWTALTNNFFTTVTAAPKNLAKVDGSETAHGATFTWTGYCDSYDMEYKNNTTSSRDSEKTIIEEGFEDYNYYEGLPPGWNSEGAGNTWIVYDDDAHLGSLCATLESGSDYSGSICYLVTPNKDLSGYSSATLTCWYTNPQNMDADGFGVFYRTSNDGEWQPLFSTNEEHDDWTQITPGLSIPCEAFIQIGFKYYDNGGFGIGLDDVLLTATESSSTGDWEILANNVTSPFTADTLQPETTYLVRVKGYLGSEAIGTSNEMEFSTTIPCPTPVLSDPTIITDQSVLLNWTGVSATYSVYYRESGETEWQQQDGVTTNTTTLTGLTAQTTYEAKVQGDCGTDGLSEESNIITFMTKCDATPVDVDNWFTESFDETTFPPVCWAIGDPTNNNKNWGRSTFKKHTGSGSAYSGAYGPIYLFTPIVNITGDLALLNFWSYEDYPTWYTGGSNDHGGLNIVKVTTDGGSTWTELWRPTISEVSSAWKSITIDLSSYIGQDIIIAFEYQGNNAHEWYIDDVTIFNGKVFKGGTTGHETDWNTADNWNPKGVPTGNQNVLINNTAQVNEGTALANAIHLGGSSLTIANGAQLQHNNEGVVATMLRSVAPYTSTKDNYVLIASPLKGNTNPTSVNNLISNSYTYDLYAFDQCQTLEWLNYKTSPKPFTTLDNGKGYLYAHNSSGGSIDLGFTGEILPSNVDMTIDINYVSGNEFSGWNLIGNPFACNAYIKDATDHIAAYYKMNENGDGFIATTDAVKPLEGIFAQATAEEQSLKFTRTAPETAPGKGNLNINVVQAVTNRDAHQATDNAIIRFDGGNSLEKFSFRNGSSKVYFPMENKEFAVVNAEDHGEIPVSFEAEENGTYTLSFTTEDVDFSYLLLIDNLTGNDVNLLDTPSYTFEARTIDYASRFRLVFAKGHDDLGNDFGFFDANGNLLVLGIEGTATLQVMDVTGRVISNETFSGNYSKALNASAGVYMLRLIQGSNVRIQKIVVK